jgi:hypothetical protein
MSFETNDLAMGYLSRVDYAYNRLPIFDLTNSTSAKDTGVVETSVMAEDYNMPDFREYPDDHPIALTYPEEIHLPHIITADNLEELRAIYDAARIVMDFNLSPEVMEGQLQHEKQHADAAKALGATSVTYGVSFSKIESDDPEMNGRICAQPCAWPQIQTDKLGVGLIASAPDELSAGDEANLRMLGY